MIIRNSSVIVCDVCGKEKETVSHRHAYGMNVINTAALVGGGIQERERCSRHTCSNCL